MSRSIGDRLTVGSKDSFGTAAGGSEIGVFPVAGSGKDSKLTPEASGGAFVSVAAGLDSGAEADAPANGASECAMFAGVSVRGTNLDHEAAAGSRTSAQVGNQCESMSSGMARPASNITLQAAFCALTFFTRRRRKPAQRTHATKNARKAASNMTGSANRVTIFPPFCGRPCWRLWRRRRSLEPQQCAPPDAAVRPGPEPSNRPCRRAVPLQTPRRTNRLSA